MSNENKPKKTGEKKPAQKKSVTQKIAENKTVQKINSGIKSIGGFLFKKMAKGGAQTLGNNADEVNNLNVFPVPDGDTGDNMRMTIESGISAIENIDSDDLSEIMNALAHGMLLGARGNSGVILSQFFAGTAKGLEAYEKATPEILGRALESGVKQAYSSVMTPTEGTILTVAREAVEYAVANIKPDSTIRTFFADLVKEMHASLDRTPEILAVLREANVVDSGGAGLFYIIDGFNRVLNGEEIEEKATSAPMKPALDMSKISFGPDSVMTYGYCTECLLQLQNAKCDIDNFDIEGFKEFLCANGDSVVAFQTESIVKLHVHTFEPEKIIGYARQFGEFLTVKIENMSVQHTELDAKASEEAPKPKEKKKYGIVAVSTGDGIEKLFKEFGADVVIYGGQTQNPSTYDFLEAFSKIYAENILVFPNNGNILMAAGQAADLYEDAKVYVIPSKSVGTGYVALSSADLENPDAEALAADMTEAMSRVTAAYISPSIRDADMNGVHVEKGDTIGIIGKEIVVSEKRRQDAANRLASMLLDMPDKFMLTAFTGIDATEAESGALEAYIRATHPDAEVYFIEGGQEIYPYIFIVE